MKSIKYIITKYIIVILLNLVAVNSITVAQTKIRKIFNLGITKDLLEDVNIRDARVTLEFWGKLLIKKYVGVEKLNIVVYDDVNKLIEDTKKNQVDVLYISSILYTLHENDLSVTPLISTKIQNESFYELYLCTSASSNINSFDQLKGSKIFIQGAKYKMINELWFDVLCSENKIKNKDAFFKKIEFVDKPMQAVLPLFMKKIDACIVNSAAFEAMSELNPQIKNSIKIITQRPNLVNDFVCVANNFNETEKNLIIDIAVNYNDLPQNEQIFKIFKTMGASRFKSSDLDGIKSLINEYKSFPSNTLKLK